MSDKPKLRFEDEVPMRFRRDEDVIVRTVGQVIDELSQLPRDLPLLGDCGNGQYRISVTRCVADWKPDELACCIDPDWTSDDDDDSFDDDYDDSDDYDYGTDV